MLSDDIDTRLARVEQQLIDLDRNGTQGLRVVEGRIIRTEQRVSDINTRVTAMIPLATNVTQLTERVEVLRRDLKTYADQVTKIDTELDKKEETLRQERLETKRAFWALTTTIVCALITAAVVIITSVF